MNDDPFYSVDRLLEFGLGLGIAQQMTRSMNMALNATTIPGPQNPLMGTAATGNVYFVVLEGRQAGPYSGHEVVRLMVDGRVTKETQAWRPGLAGWERVESIPDLLRLYSLVPPPVPGGAGS